MEDASAESFPKPPQRAIEKATTQHFPDFPEMDTNQMKDVCTRVKEVGVNSLRWNFRWAKIIGEDSVLKPEALTHYIEAMKVMKEEGLESILILSDPPEYIKNIARTGNINDFQREFRRYLEIVRGAHQQVDAGPPKVIQFENELNVGAYNDWIRIGKMNASSKFSIPELQQTLQVIKEYFPPSERLMNILFSNIVNVIAKGVIVGNKLPPIVRGVSGKEYLGLLSQCKDYFEILGIDYYPGTYSIAKWSDLAPIEDILTEASHVENDFLGKKQIAFTEFGAVSKLASLPFTPKTQRGFYAYFGRELLRILRRIEENVSRNPEKFRQPLFMVSPYQVHDEKDPYTWIENWGVLDMTGESKSYGGKRTSVDTVKAVFKLLNRTRA